jgi:hypothetical protein
MMMVCRELLVQLVDYVTSVRPDDVKLVEYMREYIKQVLHNIYHSVPIDAQFIQILVNLGW